MDFLYDETGSAYSFIYNGTQYYYVRNLQGDVVRILNTSGTTVVAYSYDAWGKCTVTTGASNAIANANPIRYRGYYYDSDTGFYYLQSRYYDPTIKRFINADDASLIGVNGDFISFNLYAYCLNNPVMCKDESGYAPEWLDWNLGLDIAVTVASAAVAIGVGIAASAVTSPIGGWAAGIATFGALNNLANAVYYNCVSDGESDLTSSSYNTSPGYNHINRWDRLDYTKSQSDTPDKYNSTASRYFAEYNLHMYGWFWTGWALEKENLKISEFADSAQDADVKVDTKDGDWYVNWGTAILSFLGF